MWPLPRRSMKLSVRAGNGTRTRDPNLGKVVLYQLSYSRAARNIPVGFTAFQADQGRSPRACTAYQAVQATSPERAASPPFEMA